MKKTILVIHGGHLHPTYEDFLEKLNEREVDLDRMKAKIDWKKTLEKNLGSDYEVYLPNMPLRDNADYELWKIWFEKVINALDRTTIILGHSLGAMFLIKYYSENIPIKSLPALLLVAPQYLGHNTPEKEQTSFILQQDIAGLTKSVEKVVFFHSEDDFVVSFKNQEKFKKAVSGAKFVTFSNKGHFNMESFPEIVKMIESLAP